MNIKGISILAICLLSAVPARALEERITLFPGKASAIGDWLTDGAVLRKGFKGGNDYVLAEAGVEGFPREDVVVVVQVLGGLAGAVLGHARILDD